MNRIYSVHNVFRMKSIHIWLLIVISFFLHSCNNDTVIGEDLLDDEEITVEFNDNFEMKGRTVRGDSVPTFNRRVHMLGEINDPIFGKASSDLYVGLTFDGGIPDYEDATFDSLIFELEYDTSAFYGDKDAVFNIEVFEIEEDWAENDSLRSDQVIQTSLTPLASISKVIDPEEDIFIFDHEEDGNDTIVELQPRLRIRLDDAFGEALLADLESDDLDVFRENYKGLYIRASVENSMIAFNFRTADNLGRSGLTMYYTAEDGDKDEYEYFVGAETFSTFNHDYSGAEIESYFNDTMRGDEFIFIQNMAGVNAEILMPELEGFENTVINSAQIEFTVVEEGEGFEIDDFPFTVNYLMSRYDENGDRIVVEDLRKEGVTVANLIALHDGQVREVELDDQTVIKTVKFNITDYISAIIDAGETNPVLIISPVERQDSPGRIVLFGPNHPEFPAKLRIAYTII